MRRATAKVSTPRRPLLAIDGDSFAHRAYHALPKTIMRRGDKPAGAILGFANVLLRLYRTEAPRAVLVGWDTLEKPIDFQKPVVAVRLSGLASRATRETWGAMSFRSCTSLPATETS
jgi:5'-3' exonuclease